MLMPLKVFLQQASSSEDLLSQLCRNDFIPNSALLAAPSGKPSAALDTLAPVKILPLSKQLDQNHYCASYI